MPRYLGQHFLNNPQIIEQIIESSNIKSDEAVLEIGPGQGVLTEKLCEKSAQVIAIELDQKLRENLEKKFQNQKNLKIIFDDILKINLPQILRENKISNYKLIANIPYYITSKIIRLFLETEIQPMEIILMIQKEVAQRIVARPGQMSKLSAAVGYFAQAEILFDVERENFNPPPEVDSSVIRIFDIKKADSEESQKYFQIVRAGFCSRRKTLANNLANSFHLNKKEAAEKLEELGFTKNSRAQELSVADWKKLAQNF